MLAGWQVWAFQKLCCKQAVFYKTGRFNERKPAVQVIKRWRIGEGKEDATSKSDCSIDDG